MAILARKIVLEGEIETYTIGLWVGAEGVSITITEGDDVSGFEPGNIPIEDMLDIGRRVRRLAKWAESPKGARKVEKLFALEAKLLSRPEPKVRSVEPDEEKGD